MKFQVSVYSDDGMECDYSTNLLTAAEAVKFINDWQAEQEKYQQGLSWVPTEEEKPEGGDHGNS